MIGSFTIQGRLGRGAMGAVYLARSPGGRLVAVKVVRDELAGDAAFRARFAREIEAARKVSGAFTAAVVDADPDAERPWLATEYLPGPTLQKAIETSGPLTPGGVQSLAGGLAEALMAIHAGGLVHRDLKPSNIVLTDNGPRVIDFGIARALEEASLTATGVVVGTPGYLSPEQITGTAIGPRERRVRARGGPGLRRRPAAVRSPTGIPRPCCIGSSTSNHTSRRSPVRCRTSYAVVSHAIPPIGRRPQELLQVLGSPANTAVLARPPRRSPTRSADQTPTRTTANTTAQPKAWNRSWHNRNRTQGNPAGTTDWRRLHAPAGRGRRSSPASPPSSSSPSSSATHRCKPSTRQPPRSSASST